MLINGEMRDALMVEDAKDLSPAKFYNLIMSAIEPRMPYLAHPGKPLIEVIPRIEYGHRTYGIGWDKVSDIKDIDNWVAVTAIVRPGSSEGIYLSVSMDTKDPFNGPVLTETPLFTLKTLGEGPDDYALMGVLAGMVQYAVELFLMIHF